jgi:hypothetical protein
MNTTGMNNQVLKIPRFINIQEMKKPGPHWHRAQHQKVNECNKKCIT